MKKLAIILGLLLAFLLPSVSAGARVIKTGASITIALDAVAVPSGSTAQYQLYFRTDPSGTQAAAGNPITATQATITFTAEGIYDMGVMAQRLVSGSVVASSTISWSNDPAVVQGGNTFVDQYYATLPNPKNLRVP